MNGFFAMAELAIVSARKSRLRQMAEKEKSPGARRALALTENPVDFLSVVQIGVTLNSILTGAFSGATLTESLGARLNEIEGIAPYGEPVALAITVTGVTYLSLVIGELVPKRIGLAFAESIAVRVSWFMQAFARVVAPVVWLLRLSTDSILRLFRLEKGQGGSVTEEDVKDMIAQGTRMGVFKQTEKTMLESVMRLADRSVRTIMTPRIDVDWLSLENEFYENIKIVRESGYSRFPVVKGDREEIVGIIRAADLLDRAMNDKPIDIKALLQPPLIVPDTTPVLRLLDHFKQAGQPLAVVIDEYGSVEGLVTVMDVLESIIGDLPETKEERDEQPVRREDGSWLVDGMTPIDEIETLIGLKNMRDGEAFHTVAGFMIDRLGRIPTNGDVFVWNKARFEVVDMDGRRVDKMLITPPEPEEDPFLP